jgi:hypothetical protein
MYGAWIFGSIVRYRDKSRSACPLVWCIHWSKQNTGLPSQLSLSHSLRIFKVGKLNQVRSWWFLRKSKGPEVVQWERFAGPAGFLRREWWRECENGDSLRILKEWNGFQRNSEPNYAKSVCLGRAWKSDISRRNRPKKKRVAFSCSGKSPERFCYVGWKKIFWPQNFSKSLLNGPT